MKKNYVMRFAAVLLVLVLLSTCVVSGTFAKYVSTDTATDSAKVAKWGVTVEVESAAFEKTYATNGSVNDGDGNAIANSVVATEKDTLAPGTSGTLAELEITGEPEVAANVTITADLVLTNWKLKDDTTEYCPLVFDVSGTEIKIGATFEDGDNNTIDNVAELEAALEASLNENKNYAVGQNIAHNITVTWEWEFDSGNDANDTELGDPATLPEISFTLTATVTQID